MEYYRFFYADVGHFVQPVNTTVNVVNIDRHRYDYDDCRIPLLTLLDLVKYVHNLIIVYDIRTRTKAIIVAFKWCAHLNLNSSKRKFCWRCVFALKQKQKTVNKFKNVGFFAPTDCVASTLFLCNFVVQRPDCKSHHHRLTKSFLYAHTALTVTKHQ